MRRRAAVIVLDGVGVGEAPDAAAYGDAGSNTLGNLARAAGGLALPNLAALGLGNIAPLDGVPDTEAPEGAWGKMQPASAGKDSTTGHWELAGLHLAKPFPTYPRGFPAEVVDPFVSATGRGVLGNVAASGTDIIDQLGAEHEASGKWILYTSADSVFQVASHENVVPLEELYHACAIAREQLVPPNNVSRVIARPFIGSEGKYERTKNRRDYSLAPPGETLLDALAGAGIARSGVGKVDDLFAGHSLSSRHTADNEQGIQAILTWLEQSEGGLLFANLVDFDTLYGHRGDVAGFARALREFDDALPLLRAALNEDDLLFITADHGNDPTTGSTDHARECVPLLVTGAQVHPVALGTRSTFSDLGATVAEWLNVGFRGQGTSFLSLLERS
ncbi:MAG TPA: phosphopentomutase [Gemmatimonadaceae bacterium]